MTIAMQGQEHLAHIFFRQEIGSCKVNPVCWDTGSMSAFDAYDYSKDRACKGKTVIWTGDDTGDRIAFQEGRILWHKKPAA